MTADPPAEAQPTANKPTDATPMSDIEESGPVSLVTPLVPEITHPLVHANVYPQTAPPVAGAATAADTVLNDTNTHVVDAAAPIAVPMPAETTAPVKDATAASAAPADATTGEAMKVYETPAGSANAGHPFQFEDPAQAAQHKAMMAQTTAEDAAAAANPPTLAPGPPNAQDLPLHVPFVGPGEVPLVVNGFQFPSLADHAAATPMDRELNPHHKIPIFIPRDPTGPADITGTSIVQPSNVDWDHTVILATTARENAHPTILENLDANPDAHLIALQFLGRRYYTERVHNAPAKLTEALQSVAPAGSFVVIPVAPNDPTFGQNTKFPSRQAGPFILLVRFTSTEAHTDVLRKEVFALNDIHAWSLVAPENMQVLWTAMLSQPSFRAITELHGAVSWFIWTSTKLGVALQQFILFAATSLEQARYELSRSVDPCWNPHIQDVDADTAEDVAASVVLDGV
ncbi:hypothetical protein B0H17DRAFT_1201349 [Mycena rosella]|uniref:Uncharacterized protein n=1 Tax=Mycena rosella TaxID=1033263 RepID=A0AAD7GED3_MYCRO|nr:hypothetical protein B0H17DRAFT_1201349 [Mycena rosella]